MKDEMNLDAEDWVLGEDYTQAPTCASCHMSGNKRNGGRITHDPGERISWTNRPPVSLLLDTDADHKVVTATDPAERAALITDTWQQKRERMSNVCSNCHTSGFVSNFYKQYDDFITLYNEKFGKPGKAIIASLREQGMLTKPQFDEEIEWTWFYLWHHEGRRARHGTSMMAPDYAHWHGMYEVAERFYMELIPQARELIEHARSEGHVTEADAAEAVIEDILARPEHLWQDAEAR
ncbi:MAG: hydroxylamine dehydrogenase [Planctomycetota bacterium]|jgi:hydroxylamine dehydrogenase